MTPPTVIQIKSDNNELTLKNTTKTKEGLRYDYIYSKSIEKLGRGISFSESELGKIIKINS